MHIITQNYLGGLVWPCPGHSTVTKERQKANLDKENDYVRKTKLYMETHKNNFQIISINVRKRKA